MSLIISEKYAIAKEAIDKMTADFTGNPDMIETLYWITERYELAGRAQDANQNYQQIIKQFYYSSFVVS